jgi:hypothetical protein
VAGIAGVEQTQQLGAAAVIEAFIGAGEQPAGPVERIVLAAPVPEGLVLDRRRTSSSRWLANFTRWNGSATWRAQGSTVSKVSRHGPDRSSTAQSICSRHPGGRASNHRHAPVAERPGMMSRSCPPATSAIVVDQAWVRQRPCRAKSTSSRPAAVTCPMRAGSSTSGVP